MNSNFSSMKVVRIFKVVRVLRALRMIRLVRFVRSIRSLIHSIVVTMKSLIWAMMLLLMIFYGFATAFAQGMLDNYYKVTDQPRNERLEFFWGTLPRAMCTLFWSISGGVSWYEASFPLSDIGSLWVAVLICFII